MKDPITKTGGRALHPREAELLRRWRPALLRAINAGRRLAERTEALRDAERIGDEVITRHTRRACDLSAAVELEALRTLREAVCEAYGLDPDGGGEDVERALECSLAVLDGGKR